MMKNMKLPLLIVITVLSVLSPFFLISSYNKLQKDLCYSLSKLTIITIMSKNTGRSLNDIVLDLRNPSDQIINVITTAYNMQDTTPEQGKTIAYNTCMGIE